MNDEEQQKNILKQFKAVYPSRNSLPQQLAAFIKLKIITNEIKAGARLPTTREATEIFGVSLTTVHDAYQILVQENILESRKRHGTFVAKWKPNHTLQMEVLLSPVVEYAIAHSISFIQLNEILEKIYLQESSSVSKRGSFYKINELQENE